MPQPAGLEADWDISPVLQQIGAYAGRLTPELDKLDPQVWASKGASETYLRQLQSSKDQARALGDQTKALMRNPEKLSATLEVLFRIQGLDTMLTSLVEGARRYQSPGRRRPWKLWRWRMALPATACRLTSSTWRWNGNTTWM